MRAEYIQMKLYGNYIKINFKVCNKFKLNSDVFLNECNTVIPLQSNFLKSRYFLVIKDMEIELNDLVRV